MTTKKQTKTKKEKQATVVEPTHKNPNVLKDLYQEQKMSAGQIAKMFNVSRAAVLFQMRKHNIPITNRKTASADAKEDYKNKTWLTNQLKKGISIFAIAKDQKVTYPEASGHGSSKRRASRGINRYFYIR
jgi:predicted DNA-binding protein YlxM (UPF0122 family)